MTLAGAGQRRANCVDTDSLGCAAGVTAGQNGDDIGAKVVGLRRPRNDAAVGVNLHVGRCGKQLVGRCGLPSARAV